ncbi:MAG: hypothetical protein ACRD4X_03870 [Candidatus Acidiferrales bacterium]
MPNHLAPPSSKSAADRGTRSMFALYIVAAIALAACCCPLSRASSEDVQSSNSATQHHLDDSPVLDSGFRQLYELNFAGARAQFRDFQQQHPDDPVGKAAEAASYLYEEFDAKGIFTSKFFLNNELFLNGAVGTPAENRNVLFLRANRETRQMAQKILKSEPNDVRALLALTLADGMESDYDALIVKKQMAGLGLMRQAEREANALLAIDPSQDDAYVALGAADYVIGCLPSYKRAFLWFGGIHGDRDRGMQEMQRAADHGHYLRPFAQILLALACEREHQPTRARVLLSELTSEFPANKRFAIELALLNARVPGD